LLYTLDASKVGSREVHFRNFYLDSNNGTVYEGNIVLTLGSNFTALPAGSEPLNLASFEAAYIGQVAKSDVALRDLDKFWNSQGVFMLTDPQTITISQGDGKNTNITLYSTDTLAELQKKLNESIGNGLGQAKYAVSDASRFVSFVEEDTTHENTLESVAGTFVIRSMVAGNGGKLSFSGDEDLIKALSLNVVQEAKENSFNVSVYDAHNSTIIASDVKVSGNLLVGVIHPNVDVEFDPMANIKVEWNEQMRSFSLTKESTPYQTILHLVDNSTVFQVGANEGEDVAVDIGNMSADALGVTRVIVTDRESAARAITILDTAINKVSTQRAKIGAFQNALEHTVTNLTTTATNLTDAESRIRDADMSQEMLNFTRLQILSQSGVAMLAQANQLPQSVLSLIRG
jgi:flagellin